MTLLELQEVLGEAITNLENGTGDIDKAKAIASLAKQMINNADVVLRAEKMFSERKLGDSNIMDMVNGGYMLLKKAPDGSLEGKTLE